MSFSGHSTEGGLIAVKNIFQCYLCEHSADTSVGLKRHVNSVHVNIGVACEICDKSFITMDDLNKHISSVHEGQYKCDLCQKCFKTKSGLKHHITSLH